jgi:Mg-chelatase subunit ChlD
MLTNIHPWCDTSLYESDRLYLSPELLGMMLDKKNNSKEKLYKAIKEKIDSKPRFMDVVFDPPQFPFDNAEFQDPFYLVEDLSQTSIDLGGIEKLNDNELKDYVKDIFEKFTYRGHDNVKIKRKELLEYVGKAYFFETIRKERALKTGKLSPVDLIKKKRQFSSFETGRMSNISLNPTMRKSILRRKMPGPGSLLEKSDIVNYTKQSDTKNTILFAIDCSKSMEQEGRLYHAKKAALSFYYYHCSYLSGNRVDFFAFNEIIEKINPLDILTLTPNGMTHTAELLHYVFSHFKGSKEGAEFYLITDGHPQAQDIDEKRYLAITIKNAARLGQLQVKTKIILIQGQQEEANHQSYEYNKQIAEAAKGELVKIGTSQMAHILIHGHKK